MNNPAHKWAGLVLNQNDINNEVAPHIIIHFNWINIL